MKFTLKQTEKKFVVENTDLLLIHVVHY